MMADGMKNGEILRGPPSSSAVCSRSIVVNPPMPDAMKTPTRGAFSGVIVSAAVVHGELRRRDGVLDEDVHLLDVLLLDELQRVEALDLARDAASANCVASNCVIGPMPLLPAQQRRPVGLACRCRATTPGRCR